MFTVELALTLKGLTSIPEGNRGRVAQHKPTHEWGLGVMLGIVPSESAPSNEGAFSLAVRKPILALTRLWPFFRTCVRKKARPWLRHIIPSIAFDPHSGVNLCWATPASCPAGHVCHPISGVTLDPSKAKASRPNRPCTFYLNRTMHTLATCTKSKVSTATTAIEAAIEARSHKAKCSPSTA